MMEWNGGMVCNVPGVDVAWKRLLESGGRRVKQSRTE